MIYKLAFLPSALKEFKQLDNSVREQFKKKLSELLENPNVPANRLSGFQNHYKVKLKASGYRLVYEVEDDKVRVLVIAVGKRDKGRIYSKARKRS
ncbi:type II toxin-antitoxin system RelE/ParE family toxin [bacterium]|nr:type II toxin-antitoxin system RelE/ParE family toxin [bacterium]